MVLTTFSNEPGNLISRDFGFTFSGTICNTSNLDSPIIPPVRMPGLEAEK
jgi:hypothetical protein